MLEHSLQPEDAANVMLKHNQRPPATGVLFRCDGTPQTGLGHVMRCLALAQAWQDEGGTAAFAMAAQSAATEARIRAADAGFVSLSSVGRLPTCRVQGSLATCPTAMPEARMTRSRQSRRPAPAARWVVVDGYHFGDTYHKAVVEAGLRVLAIDDFGHVSDYRAHLVLNQNFDAGEGLYARRRDYTRLLLGPAYVLLRREFGPWRTFQRLVPPQATKLLVTCGGSDPGNTTPKIVEALGRTGLADLEATVILGADNPNCGQILAMAERSPCPIRVRQGVEDMAEVMAWADMAVIVAGTSLWELHFMGCPTMSFGRGPLHEPILRKLENQGLLRYLGFEEACGTRRRWPRKLPGSPATSRYAARYRVPGDNWLTARAPSAWFVRCGNTRRTNHESGRDATDVPAVAGVL